MVYFVTIKVPVHMDNFVDQVIGEYDKSSWAIIGNSSNEGAVGKIYNDYFVRYLEDQVNMMREHIRHETKSLFSEVRNEEDAVIAAQLIFNHYHAGANEYAYTAIKVVKESGFFEVDLEIHETESTH